MNSIHARPHKHRCGSPSMGAPGLFCRDSPAVPSRLAVPSLERKREERIQDRDTVDQVSVFMADTPETI